MKINFKLLAAPLLTIGLTTACVEKDLGDGTSISNTPLADTTVNDFSTRQTVSLNVHYDVPTGYKVNFKVYAENPMTEVNGQDVLNDSLVAMASRFTDQNGDYSGTITLSNAADKVYIYSASFGVPQLYVASVVNKTVTANVTYAAASSAASKQMKSYSATIFPNKLGSWTTTGMPEYLDPEHKVNVDYTMMNYFNTNLPEAGNNKNKKSASGESFVTSNGDLEVLEDASRISFNFLGGTTGAHSNIGYFVYQKGDNLTTIKAALSHACLIFPDAQSSVLGRGVSVRLKNIDASGHFTDALFKKGTMIGFVLANDAWKNPSTTSKVTSNSALNADQRSHVAKMGIKDADGNAYNVISFEDWDDNDYNDIAFTISSDPYVAIETPEASKPKVETFTTETYKGVLAFEDNWPKAGDFDLNDVVMKYNSEVTLNSSNKVVKTVDTYTLNWSGANLGNAFAVQLKADPKTVSVSGTGDGFVGLDDSYSSKAVVVIFKDAKAALGQSGLGVDGIPTTVAEKTFVVTTNFSDPVSSTSIVPPYNPFIITSAGNEVHLTNYAPTGKNKQPFGTESDGSNGKTTFYVYKGNNYPFALHMDARQDATIMGLADKLHGEHGAIDKYFSGFAQWVTKLKQSSTTKWW